MTRKMMKHVFAVVMLFAWMFLNGGIMMAASLERFQKPPGSLLPTEKAPFPESGKKQKSDYRVNRLNHQQGQPANSNKTLPANGMDNGNNGQQNSGNGNSRLQPAQFPKTAHRCSSCLGQGCRKCNYTGYELK